MCIINTDTSPTTNFTHFPMQTVCLQGSGSASDGPHIWRLPPDDLSRRADTSHGGRPGGVHQNQPQTQVRLPLTSAGAVNGFGCGGTLTVTLAPLLPPPVWSGTTWGRSWRALRPWPAPVKEDASPSRSFPDSWSCRSARPSRSCLHCLTEWEIHFFFKYPYYAKSTLPMSSNNNMCV